MPKAKKFTVVEKPLKWFKPHPENPRRHPDAQVAELTASLEQSGVYKNVVALKDGTLLAGHGLVAAAKATDVKKLPVFIFNGTELEAKRLMVADNHLPEQAEDDLEQVLALLQEQEDAGAGLLGTGFTSLDELAALAERGGGGGGGGGTASPEEVQRVRDLFAGYIDSFEGWWAEFGVLPISVWDGGDPRWLSRKRRIVQNFLDDMGKPRAGAYAEDNPFFSESHFDAVLAEVLLEAYTPHPGSRVYDPFMGDVRALMAAGHGHEYQGVELSEEQAAWTLRRGEELGLEFVAHMQDSCEPVPVEDGWAEFVYTCPPYWNLEKYSDAEADLSAAPTYEAFLERYRVAVRQVVRVMAEPCFAAVVVGNFREEGVWHDFRRDTVEAFVDAGCVWHDEIVYKQPTGSCSTRLRTWRVNRRSLRNHEYVLVFLNGDLEDFRPADEGMPVRTAATVHDVGAVPDGSGVQVKVSAASMRQQFRVCDLEYITERCQGVCCRRSKGDTSVAVLEDEVKALEERGATVKNQILESVNKRCPFQGDDGLCALHGTGDKPFGCIATPLILNAKGTMLVRNRHRMLRCYKDDGPKLPVYKNFRASLDLVFGNEEAQRVCDHLDGGGGDLQATLLPGAYEKLMGVKEARGGYGDQPLRSA